MYELPGLLGRLRFWAFYQTPFLESAAPESGGEGPLAGWRWSGVEVEWSGAAAVGGLSRTDLDLDVVQVSSQVSALSVF